MNDFGIYSTQVSLKWAEEFSISDVTRRYVKDGSASLLTVGEETWVDCGTAESLLQASIMAKDGKLNPSPHRE